jgi:DNA-binding transcriptional MerR regulator
MATKPPTRKRTSAKALTPAQIPDKLYFRIGDVARMCAVPAYVLRFWESEFPQLKPNKGGSGQRLYRRRDVELVLDIKRLVHGEGYTLSGARQALELAHPRRDPQASLPLPGGGQGERRDAVAAAIGHARAELREIAGQLASPVSPRPRRRTRFATVPVPSGRLFPSE